jgi:ABC transporter with metal-binding/Fe-S-binding domain ATP-binding protein
MNAAILFSGGKDSTFALYLTMLHGWDVTHAISVISDSDESFMFHVPNIHLTQPLAEALALSYIGIMTPGDKERELDDLKRALAEAKKHGVDAVVAGAVASEYQKTRIERVCHELGLKSFVPLWRKSQEALLREMVAAGFKIRIVGVFANGFDESWLGRIIDENYIDKLCEVSKKYGISVIGEGGEYETLVVDGPIFHKKLIIDESEKKWRRDSGILTIKKAHLEAKK